MGARRTVVVGIDGSAQALRAAQWAVPEARRRQAVLRLVTAFAWTDDRLVGLPGLEPYGEHLRSASVKGLATAAAAAAEVDPDVPVEQEVVLGFPGGVLHDESRSAELLVVGDSGRGRIASAVAGSVALSVAAQSACPVVVVRGTPTAPGGLLPVVLGIDGTPLSEAAIAVAFDLAAAWRVPLIAVHTWLDEVNDPSLAHLVECPRIASGETEPRPGSHPHITAKGLDRSDQNAPLTYSAPALGSDTPEVHTEGGQQPSASRAAKAANQRRSNPNRGSRGNKRKR